MAQAERDENFVPTLLAVSNADGVTPVAVYADPTTHRLLVDLASGNGTVTSVSVVTANGFAGTVATATTTPAITLSTTITGILQGNGTAISAASTTGSGNVVLATSPTLTTPNLGTPSAATLTNATGLPISTGVSGLGTGVATALGVNTGSAGAVVLFNGALGTPLSGTLTNATGLPISTGVSGLGTDVATFLATPSSANLAAAVTDETGSGSLVFATAPTLTTLTVSTGGAAITGNSTVTGNFTASGTIRFTGLTSNRLATFAGSNTLATSITSANMLASITDPTGTGSAVFATSPTLVTPILGTPTSGTLTNCTGLPISTGVSGLGANVATFLATPSSANLIAAVSDETGSGALVFGTSPTIATATLSGAQQLAEGAGLRLDASLSADGTYSGLTISGTAGATLAFGDVIYLAAADSRWELADASAASTSGSVWVGMCVLAAASDGDPTVILLQGNVRADAAFPALTISAPVYISETAGDITNTAPTTTDSVTRVLGYGITADSMFFNPSNDWITHT